MKMVSHEKFKVGLSLTLVAAGAWLLHGFIPSLLWAIVIVIATWPTRVWIAHKTRVTDTGAAALMTTAVTAGLFLPIVYALFHAAAEVGTVAHWIQDAQKTGIAMPDWIPKIPSVGNAAAEYWKANLSDPVALSSLVQQTDPATAADYARRFGLQVFHRFFTLLFTLLTIFFLYKDGDELAHQSLDMLDRMVGESGRRYGLQAAVAIRATVSGLVLVGLAEGLLIGISYALAGAAHPAIFGILTGISAVIPFAAPIVFGGVAVVLAANGSAVAGICVFVFGMVVLFIGDHFVRPKIIGSAVKLPFLWVLLGILGGVEVFGLIGLFVGPALMALLMTMWRDLTEMPTEDAKQS